MIVSNDIDEENTMKTCIACNGKMYGKTLFELKNMPRGAQIMPKTEELNQDEPVALKLEQCRHCGLVQLSIDPIDYYKDAIRVGNLTKTMIDLRNKEFQKLVCDYGLKGKKVIEIGCSTGEYVDLLNEFGMLAYGLEHSELSCKTARSRGLNIYQGYIEDEDYRIGNFLFDGFVCYNFLEHQPNPIQFLRGIYNNLSDKAYGIITVPSFDYMVNNSGLYEITRDHLSYFTKDTFQKVLEYSGFRALDISTINNDTLIATVKKQMILDLQKQIRIHEQLINSINEFVKNEIKQKRKIAVWGASHQCFTVLAITELGNNIEYIIDSSPRKQERYSPVTHLQIVHPDYFFEKKVDTIIIMAPGYAKEIEKIVASLYGSYVKVGILFADKLCMGEQRL